MANNSDDGAASSKSDAGKLPSVAHRIHSRRAFLKGIGAAATVVGAAPIAAAAMPDVISDLKQPRLNINARRNQAYLKRLQAAAGDRRLKTPPQTNNGDEKLYPNGIANFTKGFAHDQYGVVEPAPYAAYLQAIATGQRADFDNLAMGGNTPLVDPQAGLAFDLETCDPTQHSMPPFDTLSSPSYAAQMVETYWMALVRDVPFAQWSSNSTIAAAAAELTSLPAYTQPRDGNGNVTPQNIFRGFTAGDVIGPYVSQFFLQPFSIGAIPFQGYSSVMPGDYGISAASWLAIQNGQGPFPAAPAASSLRYLGTGRDLAEYVHNDVLFQEYLNAALVLLKMSPQFSQPVLNSGNPYIGMASETGFITFGLPMVESMVAEVIVRAIKNAWYQKWFVQRVARPEEFAGLVNYKITANQNYPIDSSVLNSQAAATVFNRNGNYFIPLSYPEGCPLHPSYPSGHATAAGAAATVLKWFFNESLVIPNPLTTTDAGTGTTAYTGSDAGQITIGAEINKLASNVGFGRVFSGIHWREDIEQGMLLGEAVAINLLRDQAHLYNENYTGFTFTMFNGNKITV